MVDRAEVKIGGFGGQGVILSGIIIGKAASLYDNKHATLIQAFGPEARGSACSAQVVLSDEYIGYPYITKPRYQVIMSQEAYTKFVPELADDGVLMYEEDLVKLDDTLKPGIRAVGVPATRIAEELGHRIILNIVMVGFFTAVSGLVSEEAARRAIEASVPTGTESLNLNAFNRGYDYGKSQL
ncbi:MAG: 2-oxoacid:acceptor oxidoreductase family protein [Planctomycetes bacterium]|nr:2-oxoacid:acceptor oxidoreductase family protein [Planctomycetota bacterium]